MEPSNLHGASVVEFQQHIKAVLTKRGFDEETIAQKFMLLLEEMGELAQAARKHAKIKTAKEKELENLEDEIGDVFILLLDLCNKLGVDAETAIIQKETKNNKRTWS